MKFVRNWNVKPRERIRKSFAESKTSWLDPFRDGGKLKSNHFRIHSQSEKKNWVIIFMNIWSDVMIRGVWRRVETIQFPIFIRIPFHSYPARYFSTNPLESSTSSKLDGITRWVLMRFVWHSLTTCVEREGNIFPHKRFLINILSPSTHQKSPHASHRDKIGRKSAKYV